MKIYLLVTEDTYADTPVAASFIKPVQIFDKPYLAREFDLLISEDHKKYLDAFNEVARLDPSARKTLVTNQQMKKLTEQANIMVKMIPNPTIYLEISNGMDGRGPYTVDGVSLYKPKASGFYDIKTIKVTASLEDAYKRINKVKPTKKLSKETKQLLKTL